MIIFQHTLTGRRVIYMACRWKSLLERRLRKRPCRSWTLSVGRFLGNMSEETICTTTLLKTESLKRARCSLKNKTPCAICEQPSGSPRTRNYLYKKIVASSEDGCPQVIDILREYQG